METKINWIRGDYLKTHTSLFMFEGTYKGRLCFSMLIAGLWTEFCFRAKEIDYLVSMGEWKKLS